MDRTNVIGEKVKSLRTAKEISLEELADRTGLAVEQITRIEENIDIPSLAPLVKLAPSGHPRRNTAGPEG